MGTCSNCVCTDREQSFQDFKRAIESENTNNLKWYLTYQILGSIDQHFCYRERLSLNPLSYALIRGKVRSFIFIRSRMGASIEIMEQKLEKQGQSGLNLICEQGFDKLLEHALPFYQERLNRNPTRSVRMSLDFNSSLAIPAKESTPAMMACSLGHLNIIKVLHKHYSRNKDKTPPEINLHTVDDITGENCAFVACKRGNLNMVKYLHEECKADFKSLNKRNESCVQVLLSGYRRIPKKTFYPCLVFLVEKIGLDITYNYEETLLLADGDLFVKFIVNKLAEKGIQISKEEIEIANRIGNCKLIDDPNYTFAKDIISEFDFSVMSRISVVPFTSFEPPKFFNE